jgi:hypothetical protein
LIAIRDVKRQKRYPDGRSGHDRFLFPPEKTGGLQEYGHCGQPKNFGASVPASEKRTAGGFFEADAGVFIFIRHYRLISNVPMSSLRAGKMVDSTGYNPAATNAGPDPGAVRRPAPGMAFNPVPRKKYSYHNFIKHANPNHWLRGMQTNIVFRFRSMNGKGHEWR